MFVWQDQARPVVLWQCFSFFNRVGLRNARYQYFLQLRDSISFDRQLSIDSSRRLRVQGQEPLRQAPKYQTKGKPHKLYRNPLSVQGANLQLYLNKMFKTQPMFRLSPTKPSEVKHSQRQRSAFSTLTPRAAGNNVGSVLHSNEPQDKVVGVSPSNLTLDGHNEKMASYLEQGHFGYVHGTNRKNSSVMTGGQPQGGASKNQSQGHSKAKGVSDGRWAQARTHTHIHTVNGLRQVC